MLREWAKKILILTVIWFLFFTRICFAVTPGEIPASVDPGLIQKRLQEQTFQPSSTPTAPEFMTKEPAPLSPELQKIKFKLTGVVFKGNTVFSDAELLKIFEPSIGRTISLADLEGLVAEVTKKYRSAGYVISRAILPPQTIIHGVVTVQVIEGFIDEVRAEGVTGSLKELVEDYGQAAKESRPFQIAILERKILLLNDLSGLNVKAIIIPSKTTPGGADLLLVTEKKNLQGLLSYDDYGTRYIGPQQITATASLNSFIKAGASDNFRYVTVPRTTELNFLQWAHSNPIGADGLSFSLGASYADSHPLFTLTPLDIRGRSKTVSTGLTYPLIRTREKNVYLHGGLNYENVSSNVLDTLFYYDRVRSFDISVNADQIDSWHGINNGSIDLEQGLHVLGANQHFNQSRPNGVPDYTKFILSGSRTQFFGQRFSILAAISGQYSCNPLLAVEQYAYGGSEFGRGYDPSEIVGDDGLAGKLELRANATPEWAWLQAMQYYLFYDAGEIWNRDTLNQPAKQTATSAGFGIRVNFVPHLAGNFYIAKPLTLPVATLQAINQNGNQFRTFFQIVLDV